MRSNSSRLRNACRPRRSAVIVITVAPVRAVAREAAPTASPAEQSRRGSFRPGERRARALDQEFYEAANAGDYPGVREMVEAGANANAVIDGDGSPLIVAARRGRLDQLALLVQRGADVNLAVEGDETR